MHRNRGVAILRDLDDDSGNTTHDPTTIDSPRRGRSTWNDRIKKNGPPPTSLLLDGGAGQKPMGRGAEEHQESIAYDQEAHPQTPHLKLDTLRLGGPVSPFSPLFNRNQSRVNWKDEAMEDLSLSICRKVSVVVMLRHKSKASADKTCLFPPVPDPRPTEISREIIVVNPKAFGDKISANITMDTARLAAEVADTADWARSYKFHQVVWPNQKSNALENLTQALANDILAPGSIAQRLLVGYGNIVMGHGPLTKHMYGSVAKQSVVQAFAQEESKYYDEVLERYGMLGWLTKKILPKLEKRVCSLSILEIVGQDRLYDLLMVRPYYSKNPVKVKLSHQESCGVVTGMSEAKLDSVKQLGHLVRRAFAAALHSARKSPRGHILTTISIYDESDPSRRTACRFLDLACTETPLNRKAILALGAVLRSILLREAGNETPVTFRGALLTKVLQKSMIQTDSRVVVLTSTSTSSDDYEQTMNTLRFMNHLLARPGDPVRSPFNGTRGQGLAQVSTEDQFAGQEGRLLQEVLSDPRQRLAKVFRSAQKERQHFHLAEAYIPRSFDDPDDDAFIRLAENETDIQTTELKEIEQEEFLSSRPGSLKSNDQFLFHESRGSRDIDRDIELLFFEDQNMELPQTFGNEPPISDQADNNNQVDSICQEAQPSQTKIVHGGNYDEGEWSNHHDLPQKNIHSLHSNNDQSRPVEDSQLARLKYPPESPGSERGHGNSEDTPNHPNVQDTASYRENSRSTFGEKFVDEDDKECQLLIGLERVHSSVPNEFSSISILHNGTLGGDALLTNADHVEDEPHGESPSVNSVSVSDEYSKYSNHNFYDGVDLNEHTKQRTQIESIDLKSERSAIEYDLLDERDRSNYRYDLMEKGRAIESDNRDTSNPVVGSTTRISGCFNAYHESDKVHPALLREEAIDDDTSMWKGVQPWGLNFESTSMNSGHNDLLEVYKEDEKIQYCSEDMIEVRSSSSVDPEIQALAAGVDRLDKQLRALGRTDTADEGSQESNLDYLNDIEIESSNRSVQQDVFTDRLMGAPRLLKAHPSDNVRFGDGTTSRPIDAEKIFDDDSNHDIKVQPSLNDRHPIVSLVEDPPAETDLFLPSKGVYVPNGDKRSQHNGDRSIRKSARRDRAIGSTSIETETSSDKSSDGRPDQDKWGDNQPTYAYEEHNVLDCQTDNFATVSSCSFVGENAHNEMSAIELVLQQGEEVVDTDPSDPNRLESLLLEMRSNSEVNQAEQLLLEKNMQDDHTWKGDSDGFELTNRDDHNNIPIARNPLLVSRISSWTEQDMRKDVKYDLPPDSPSASSCDHSHQEKAVFESMANDPVSYTPVGKEGSLVQHELKLTSYKSNTSPSRAELKTKSVWNQLHESDNHKTEASSFFNRDIHSKCSGDAIMSEPFPPCQTASPRRISSVGSSKSYDDVDDHKQLQCSADDPTHVTLRSDYSEDRNFEKPSTQPTCKEHADRYSLDKTCDWQRDADDKHPEFGTELENDKEEDRLRYSSKKHSAKPAASQQLERSLSSEITEDRSRKAKDQTKSRASQSTTRISIHSNGTSFSEGAHYLRKVTQKFNDNDFFADRQMTRLPGFMSKVEVTTELPRDTNDSKPTPSSSTDHTEQRPSTGHGREIDQAVDPQESVTPLDTTHTLPQSSRPWRVHGFVDPNEDYNDQAIHVAHENFGSLSRMLISRSTTTRSIDDGGLSVNTSTKEHRQFGTDDKCLSEIDELEATVRTTSNVWQDSLVSIENLRKFLSSQKAALLSLRNERDEAVKQVLLLQTNFSEVTDKYNQSLVNKDAEIAKLGAELSEVKSVRKEVVKIAEEAISTQAELEAKLSELQLQLEHSVSGEAYNSLRIESDVARMQLEAAQKQVTKMKETVNEQNEALIKAKEELGIESARNRELEVDLSLHKDSIGLLQRQLSSLKERSNENMESMRQQLLGLSKELKVVKGNAVNLEDEKVRLTQLLESRNREHIENRDALESELRKIDVDAAAWARERKDLLGQVVKLKDQIGKHDLGSSSLREKVMRLEEERNTLQERLQETEIELEKRIRDVTELTSGVENLLAQKEEERQKVSEMEASLASFQEITRTKVQKVVRHRREAAALLDKTIEENKSLESMNDSLKETIEQLYHELSVLRNHPTPQQRTNHNSREIYIDGSGVADQSRPRNDHYSASEGLPSDGRIRLLPTNYEASALELANVNDMVDLTAHLALSARRGSSGNVRSIYSTIFTLDEAKDNELIALKRRIKALERQNATGYV